jgi:hypothetical protein
MPLAIAMAIVGIILLIIVFARFGVAQLHKNVASVPGLLLLLGLGLITAAIIYGVIAQQHIQERAKFDETLVKMFGRAPDKLELEGDTLSEFHGTATYGGKVYTIATRITGANDSATKFEITATPLTPQK